MITVIMYFLSCFCLGALSFALHWGASSQLLVLLMGLAIFPLQKWLHRGSLSDLGRLPPEPRGGIGPGP